VLQLKYVTACGALPFKVVFTPVLYTMGFLHRSTFAIRPYKKTGTETSPPPTYENIERALSSENRDDRLDAVRRLAKVEGLINDSLTLHLVAACRQFDSDTEFCIEAMKTMQNRSWKLSGDSTSTVLPLAVQLAKRQESALRSSALSVVRILSTHTERRNPLPARSALRQLFDFYVETGDAESEMACFGKVYWPVNGPARHLDLPTLLHFVDSWEKRGSPAYAGFAEFASQKLILDARPELWPRAVDRGWRIARVNPDWPNRVEKLLDTRVSHVTEGQAVTLAKDIVKMPVILKQKRETLLAHPKAVLAIVQAVDRGALDENETAHLDFLIADLLTQFHAKEFIKELAELSSTEFKAFLSTYGSHRRWSRQPRR
jgi:hypothetical protein